MITKVRDWLDLVWPSSKPRAEVVHDYLAIGQHKHFLADLALRGSVYGPCHVPGDPQTSLVNEGRRQLALEIIKLAGEHPDSLFALIERGQPSTRT